MSTRRPTTHKSFPKHLLAVLAPAIAIAALTSPAAAQSKNAEAERYNALGKEHFKERRYLDAYKNFKLATAASPEGRYYFNLCFSLNYLERFQEAIEACEQVQPNGADAKLRDKTNAVLKALRTKVPAQQPPDPNTQPPDPNTQPPDPNTQPPDPNTQPPDPNTQPPNPNTNPPVTTPSTGPATVPGLDPFATKEADTSYQWSLTGGVAPVVNLGIGSFEDPQGRTVDVYSGSGLRFNAMANFMFLPAQQIGVQGYLGFTNIAADNDQAPALSIVDIGAAVYKHFPATPQIEITALAGIHIAGFKPDPDNSELLAAFGLRASVSADYAFGARKEHVLSVAPALNLYAPASDTTELNAAEFGLQNGSASFEFGLSYQYRFTSAFGSSNIFSLE